MKTDSNERQAEIELLKKQNVEQKKELDHLKQEATQNGQQMQKQAEALKKESDLKESERQKRLESEN